MADPDALRRDVHTAVQSLQANFEQIVEGLKVAWPAPAVSLHASGRVKGRGGCAHSSQLKGSRNAFSVVHIGSHLLGMANGP